jgi:hypothetical protein
MPKITLKRVIDNSGATADLFPTTTVDQIISEGTGVAGADESLSSFLVGTYIPLSQKAVADGVATLNSSGKVPFTQLPASVTGGMKFVGTIDASAGNTEANAVGLSTLFDELTYANFATDAPELVGSYRVVTDAGWIKNSAGTQNTTAYFEFRVGQEGASNPSDAIGEEGDNTSPIYLEIGDWIVFTARRQPTGGVLYYVFSIINNTYSDATSTVKGVVQLSSASDTSAFSGDKVITESVLDGLIGAIGAANKLAPAAHNHDAVYYTETEIGNILGGSTGITGYNKTDWDNAYSGEITGLSYSSGTITLARGSGSEADLTASITGSIDFGTGSVITADRFAFKNDTDGSNESPLWSLVENDNQPSVQSYAGPGTTANYAIIHENNLVTKATAADFEKIFYLASGVANTDTTVGSIIIQID